VFAYMAFVTEKNNPVWKVISLIMVVLLLFLIAKTLENDSCLCLFLRCYDL
jgi:hypothetical protein